VLAVLLLRGPQTIGELRSRTERMVEFDDLAGVEHELDLLEHQAGGLVVSVPRRPGQKEGRFAHRLGDDDPTVAAEVADSDGGQTPEVGAVEMWAAIETLQQEVMDLRAQLDEVRTGLGLDGGDD